MNGKPKILLTGASGFTGRYVAEVALSQGLHCAGIYRSKLEAGAANIEAYVADITNPGEVTEAVAAYSPDYFIHLAAVSHVAHEDLAQMYSVNVLGTVNILQALNSLTKPVRRVVLASSANIYGVATKLPITEETLPYPVNHYSVSKASMESAAQLYTALPITVCRPFNYTGRGQSQSFLIPKIVSAFRNFDDNINLGNVDVARDFSDVRDIAQDYIDLLRCDISLVNLCSGKPVFIREVFEALEQLTGHKVEVQQSEKLVRSSDIPVLFGSPERLLSTVPGRKRFAFMDTLDWMLSC